MSGVGDRGYRRIRLAIATLVALLVCFYYLWQARAANGPFEWHSNLNGYYDLLARGWLAGHLHTAVEPSPQLLALPNPWDPAVDDSLKWQDMALYGGHYYLYFGAAPAAILFAPWRLATGHDLPENFAVFLLCFGGFLFSCAGLAKVLDLAGARPGPALLAFLFLGVGVCQSAPFLLNRAAVYEVAIASGYCLLMGGVCFLAWGMDRPVCLAVSGLMFGLAAASRPHLALAGAIALIGVALRSRRGKSRDWLWFAGAFALLGIAIAAHNYARFGSPVEFGFRYQLAGPGQNRVEVSPRNLPAGLYYMLLSRPEFSRVFPWMRMVFRFPFDSAARHPLPPDYFVEPSVGALWMAPFLIFAWALRTRYAKRAAETRLLVAVAAAGGTAILLFLMSTHLATHRYEVDFVPLLVFAALANLALWRSGPVAAAACVLIAYSAAANLAIAVAGPYEDFLKLHPARYVRLARHFSFSRDVRPEISPRINVSIAARFGPAPAGFSEPLVTIGHSHHCYFLYAQRGGPVLRLVSKTNESKMEFEMPEPDGAPVRISLAYESGWMTVAVNGTPALRHEVGMLVAAPAQVEIGENLADMGLTARAFTGSIEVLEKRVE